MVTPEVAETINRDNGSRLWCLAASLIFAGCTNPQLPEALPLASAPPFSPAGQVELASRWWTAFDDEELDEHIEAALGESFSLVAAWERLRAARAAVDREASDLFPDLDGTAGIEHDDASDADDQTEYAIGLAAGYEIDLWGRIESRVEAERFRAAATLADYQTAALTLSAEVALTWYRLAEAELQLDLVSDQIATNQTVLELLLERFAAGRIRSADVLRQEQLLEATREQAIVVHARRDTLRHQLAVLLGRPPQAELAYESNALPPLPPTPATGLPADLVRRRPDVRSRYLLIEAADRDLASAVTDQYPRITLTASLATAAESPENLFREWIASLAGQVVAPLFDAGQRRAEVERTAAVARQRLAEYGQTVLIAFQEVEDALALERYQVDRIDSIGKQLTLSRRTLEQLRTQYLNGVTDYLAVLDALTEQQRLQRELLTARLDRIEFRIALYRALAGSFDTPREAVARTSQEQKQP